MKIASFKFLVPHRAATGGGRRGERGVALVITLILLSVTLVMAVAFLALSRREREANATTTDATQARLAAESALAAAESQIVANIYATNAASYNFGLMVSTNFINTNGFNVAGAGNPLDVSYVDTNGVPLAGTTLAQNIANLQILPRAPVFIPTNGLGNDDFRFYLDLNRNGLYDPNGFVATYTNFNGAPVYAGNAVEVGDPEWVGVLERPDQMHSPVNRFVSRYAFFAMPVGNSLDINAIHNQARSQALSSGNDGYMRDQGVGSWELNLAAFFADLNTNVWSVTPLPNNLYYSYGGNSGAANFGIAFNDALSVLSYRYNNNYTTLSNAASLFGLNASPFIGDGIDLYDNFAVLNNTLLNEPWVGADNVNHFFSLPDDLFDTSKLPASFVNRLTSAGTNADTYSRYSFYRMLAQLGTDSSAESGKLNLNYMNVDPNTGNIIPGAETNLVRWPNGLTFFTNAADRMLKTYTTNWFQRNPSNYLASYYGLVFTNKINPDGYGLTNIPYYGMTNQVPGFGLTNIPVYLNGQFIYSPAINRILQLAANIYDASTNATYPQPAFFPSVYRPLLRFTATAYETNVFIYGYQQVGNTSLQMLTSSIPVDISARLTQAQPYNYTYTNENYYGIPWILGAKKYLPGFNQISMFNQVQVTRKLQFTRDSVTSKIGSGVFTTNQCYVIGISNDIAASFWNSYQSNYPGTVTVFAQDTISMALKNSQNGVTYGAAPMAFQSQRTLSPWPGSAWLQNPQGNNNVLLRTPSASSFVPFEWPYNFVFPASFLPSSGTFATGTNVFDTGATVVQLPQLQLSTTNWFYSVVLDSSGYIVDYVQLATPRDSTNLNTALADVYPPGNGDNNNADYNLWVTNATLGGILGINQQINISSGTLPVPTAFWNPSPIFPAGAIQDQRTYFAAFFTGDPTNQELIVQAPYTPTRTLFCPYLYQPNDPLVHYLASDLNGTPGDTALWGSSKSFVNGRWAKNDGQPQALPTTPVGVLSSRYQPWGIMNQMTTFAPPITNGFDLSFKDPLVWGPDYWDFPTNLYPTVGWLGRVHRGTPWQTVYFKASDVLSETMAFINGGSQSAANIGTNLWALWTGDYDAFDAANVAPTQDRLLFDIFTTGVNDNATHGKLSVNQTGFAAWSALFSGMVALTNTTMGLSINPPITNAITTAPWVISPAGVEGQNSALWQVYTNVSAYRSYFPQGVFAHMGDVLSAPGLTEQSPFLNTNFSALKKYPQTQYGISDELYEWLPQQAMSLLKVSDTPRYVIYCYGQALRPAANGTYNAGAGPLFNLVTNYQVVAETGVRAVVQVHPQVTATATGFVTNYTTTVESSNLLPPH